MIKIPGLFTINLKQIVFPIVLIIVGILLYEGLKKTILKLTNTKKLKD